MASKCVPIQVTQPKPIVTITTVTANPPAVAPGDTVVLTASVMNSGSSNGTVIVTFKKGSVVVGTTAAQVITPNNTVSFKSLAIPITEADVGEINFCAETQCTEC